MPHSGFFGPLGKLPPPARCGEFKGVCAPLKRYSGQQKEPEMKNRGERVCFATQPVVQPGSFCPYVHRPPQAGRINRLLCPASCKRRLRIFVRGTLHGKGERLGLPAQTDLDLGTAGTLVKVDAADRKVPQHALHDLDAAIRQLLHFGGL